MHYGFVAARFVFVSCFLAFSFFLWYTGMPTLAMDFIPVYLLGFFTVGVTLFVLFLEHVRAIRNLIVLSFAIFVGIAFIYSTPILRSADYYQLLGKETLTDFEEALPPIDIHQAPLVSSDMAKQAMQKRLSERSALGSQVEILNPVKQLVNGKLVWVAFLEHRSIFSWFKEGSTPGYVVVSATDPSDVRLVTEIEGKPLRMQYLLSGYFSDSVERRAYTSGLWSVGLTYFLPEIDESGRPFYVATTYRHSVGFLGSDATGVVVVDAQTGEVKTYSIAEAPAWVDRAQPERFIRNQLSDRGEYVHGWFNPSNEDRLQIADDLDLVYGTDGKSYWVGGMTATGKNNTGVSAFYFVDSRTKQVRSFKTSAVTQSTAMHAVENVNPEKRYTATNPLPFKVANVPTYVMALRDSQGVSRAFGMVDMRNNQVIAVGDTLAATLRSYQSKRSMDKTSAEVGVKANVGTIEGKVARISAEFRNNQTMYFLLITPTGASAVSGVIYTGSSDLSEELVLTKPGDAVRLSFANGDTRMVGLTDFRNLEIPAVKKSL